MTWSRVQGNNTSQGAGASLTFNIGSGGSAVTSGDLCVGVTTFDSALGQTLSSVTDNNSNTWNIADSVNLAGDSQAGASFWCSNFPNGLPTSVTLNYSASVGISQGLVTEYSNTGGAISSTPTDGHTAQTQTGATNPTSGNIATTANGDLIWGGSYNGSSAATLTAGSGFTIRESNTVFAPIYSEDQTQTSSGTIAATFTGGAADFGTFVIAFKAPGGGDVLMAQIVL